MVPMLQRGKVTCTAPAVRTGRRSGRGVGSTLERGNHRKFFDQGLFDLAFV